jgi:hypothetical protein
MGFFLGNYRRKNARREEDGFLINLRVRWFVLEEEVVVYITKPMNFGRPKMAANGGRRRKEEEDD